MKRYLLAMTLALVFTAQSPAASPPPARTLENAVGVLDDLSAIPLKGIPPKLLADAQGVAIFPRVLKAGFVVGGRGGCGVVLTRDRDGNWSDPVFVHFGGASVGFQAGVESTDVVLVFRSRKSLDRVLAGKDKLTLGADASIAAGPIGRHVMAATDAKLEAEILSYSRSRGLFAGVSFDGGVIFPDPESNAEFGKSAGPNEKKWAEQLKVKLEEMSSAKEVPTAHPTPYVPPPILQDPVPVKRPRFRLLGGRPLRGW
jgi:lipid-binding SYLF domain-containing protein